MQLLRDRSVKDRFEVALDRGQRRTEIMGDIGNEITLVFFHILKFGGHIVQGVSEVADFVMMVESLDLIIQMSGCIFPCGKGDLPERDVDIDRKDEQDDQ